MADRAATPGSTPASGASWVPTGEFVTASQHTHEWSEWIAGSNGAQYRYCLDSYCSDGEIR